MTTSSTCSPPDTSDASVEAVPVRTDDAINARILSVSEDKIQGFAEDPLGEIARHSGVEAGVVIERVQAMLRAGVIRRVRQTLLATNLAPGSLVAWQVPEEKLSAAFDWMFERDPFSGHVVVRTTDAPSEGARYRLWTTLKVPRPFSMQRHCEFLCEQTGATAFRLMPARRLFALGVGHVRRRGMEPGSKSEEPAQVLDTTIVELNDHEWRVLTFLKREFEPGELSREPWRARAQEAGVEYEEFLRVATDLNARGVIGRFSTFLEHAKPLSSGERVTRFNALFHWKVPEGREIEAGREVGRFHIMTHAYWREGGPEFKGVNIMGVAHNSDKKLLLDHKAAIDEHLEGVGIPVSYTNVFWGGRSEIKPSEISPFAYREWAQSVGLED
jgi:DNA-binding Lrp family transcriptional regulator